MNNRFRNLLSLACLFALGATLSADTTVESSAEIPLLSPSELEELLGPIALYPDSIIALVLPACTNPTDIVRSARFIDSQKDSSLIDTMPWDESVIALAHYPDVVRELDENLEWAIQVGDAFLVQPEDVMRAIQRLRARARALGHLESDPHQSIIAEDQVIRIVPNDPEVVYIPTYDTRVVYVDRYVGVPSIEYATWFGIGSWLCFDLDWASWNVRVVKPHWRTHWYQSRPWHRPDFHRRDPFWSHRDRFRDWTPPRKPHPRSFRDHNPPKWNHNPGRNDYHPSPNPSKRPSFSRPVAPRHDSFRKPEAWHSPSRHSSGNLKPDRRPDRDHRPTPRLNKEPKSGYTSPSNHIPDRSFRKRDHNPPKDHGKIHPRPSFESKRPPTPKASRFNNKAPRQPAIGIRPPSGSPHPSNRYPGKGTPSQGNGPGKKHDR